MDVTPLGELVARLMDEIDEDEDLGAEAQIAYAAVVVEVTHEAGSDIYVQGTSDRAWVNKALLTEGWKVLRDCEQNADRD